MWNCSSTWMIEKSSHGDVLLQHSGPPHHQSQGSGFQWCWTACPFPRTASVSELACLWTGQRIRGPAHWADKLVMWDTREKPSCLEIIFKRFSPCRMILYVWNCIHQNMKWNHSINVKHMITNRSVQGWLNSKPGGQAQNQAVRAHQGYHGA